MNIAPDQIQASRSRTQGYPNFYEPIVEGYFHLAGYHILRRPALVRRADIQRLINALFDGYRRLGLELDEKAIRRHVEGRKRLQPDFLLEQAGPCYLAEQKSWGGFCSGQFDLDTVPTEFVDKFRNGL